jgi:hypothetical protein
VTSPTSSSRFGMTTQTLLNRDENPVRYVRSTLMPADEVVQSYFEGPSRGELFVDPGHGNVHTAFNRTDDVTVVYATFFEVPTGGPLTITKDVKAPADCEL